MGGENVLFWSIFQIVFFVLLHRSLLLYQIKSFVGILAG